MRGGILVSTGGRYVPEMFLPALQALEREYLKARKDRKFLDEFTNTLNTFVGRPSPLTFAENLTKKVGGGKIYL